MAERLLPGLTHLFLVFEDCGIGEAGACAVAERLPLGLTVLGLVFGGCGMEEAGARVVVAPLVVAVVARMSTTSNAGTRLWTTEAGYRCSMSDAQWFFRCTACRGNTPLCDPCRTTWGLVCPKHCQGELGLEVIPNSDFESSTDVTSGSCATQVNVGTSFAPLQELQCIDIAPIYPNLHETAVDSVKHCQADEARRGRG